MEDKQTNNLIEYAIANWSGVQKHYFMQFLLRHKVYENFINNFYYQNGSFKLRFNGLVINQAFSWRITEEGDAFWNNISEKWISFYYSNFLVKK